MGASHPTESDRRALSLAPLPPDVLALLATHDARPRLVPHLTVRVRAKDAWNCTDGDDTGAVTVGLATPLRPLLRDGTYGAPVSSVRVRNAEAWILGDGM